MRCSNGAGDGSGPGLRNGCHDVGNSVIYYDSLCVHDQYSKLLQIHSDLTIDCVFRHRQWLYFCVSEVSVE